LRPQPDASTVSSIALTTKKAFSDQSLEDSGHRARMQVDDTRDLPGGETRTVRHDPKDQPLRTSDSERCLHSFGRALEPMLDVPQEPHEIQNRIQIDRLGRLGLRRGPTVGHRLEPSRDPADALIPTAAMTGRPQIAVACTFAIWKGAA
jgi:hypothetical protein